MGANRRGAPMFTFNSTPRMRFGAGALGDLPTLLGAQFGSRLLVVTDAGMVATGLVDRLRASLAENAAQVHVFSGVIADPPEEVVRAATAAAHDTAATGVIGFGGGSSLDVAKLAALLAVGGEELSDIYGIGNVRGPRLPLALVPTTAGTGSEATPISIVTTGAKQKMGVVSPILLPDLAVLDPELTLGLPAAATAATGVDAIVHAIEAYASANPNNNPVSQALAREALRLMGPALERAVAQPDDRAARADMLLGSYLAGQAFANSPVAAVHALAYPLGGHYKLPHGLTNALVLPHVLRFNAATHPAPYADLAPLLFPGLAGVAVQSAATALPDELAALARRCGLPGRLRDVGVPRADLPELARDAMAQSRLLVNNPRPVSEADAQAIYVAAW